MDNKVIITESSSRIRGIAKSALKGQYFNIVLGVLIYTLLTTVACDVIDKFTSIARTFYIQDIAFKFNFGIGSGLYNFIFSGVFNVGLCIFIMSFLRRREIRYSSLFDAFNYFLKTIGLTLLMGIKILLWSFLFVIPGIIAAIRYSQAYYILADHPDYKVSDCIKESCYLMMDNKMNYFLLILSFIGWLLLASLPQGIYNSLIDPTFGVLVVSDNFNEIMHYVFMIPDILVSTYMLTARGVFHDLLTGRLAPVKNEVTNENN